MKKKTESEKSYILFVIFVSVLFLSIFLGKNVLTGRITAESTTAQGGYVNQVDIQTKRGVNQWGGIYGELVENETAKNTMPITVKPGTLREYNLSFPCLNGQLYASTTAIFDWDKMVEGTPKMIDDYLRLTGTVSESATSMFTENRNYSVNTCTTDSCTPRRMQVPATYTIGKDTNDKTFDVGLINDTDNIVLLTHVVADKQGFDGKTHDYQLLLPTNKTTTKTFYLAVDCEKKKQHDEERDIVETGMLSITITDSEIPVTALALDILKKMRNLRIGIITYVNKPGTVNDFSGIAYRYMDIDVEKDNKDDLEKEEVNASDIAKTTVSFSVPVTWISQNNADSQTVTLFRYVDAAWVKLDTKMTGSNANAFLYDAITPGFSTFVIGAEKSTAGGKVSGGVGPGTGKGGGGGGQIAPTLTAERVWTNVVGGSEVGWVIPTYSIALRSIITTLRNTITTYRLTVKASDTAPERVPGFFSETYQYFEVTRNIALSDIKSIKLRFAVKDQWVKQNGGITAVGFYRYTTKWTNIPITYLGIVDGYHSYEAVVPDFSFFVIASETHHQGVKGTQELQEKQQEKREDRAESIQLLKRTTEQKEASAEEPRSVGRGTKSEKDFLVLGTSMLALSISIAVLIIMLIHFIRNRERHIKSRLRRKERRLKVLIEKGDETIRAGPTFTQTEIPSTIITTNALRKTQDKPEEPHPISEKEEIKQQPPEGASIPEKKADEQIDKTKS